MEKYENEKNDILQTQRIKQLDKYSISIKYSIKHKPQTFSRVCLPFIT